MTNTQGTDPSDVIAIVGMAGRFPGARNIEEFWRNLRDGVESVSFFTEQELEASGVARTLYSNPNYVRAGAVLDDAELFDASFFGCAPKEAELMDPQHRHFLECAWEALEHAGHDPERFEGTIGVYAGVEANTYLLHLYAHPELLEEAGRFQTLLANDKDYLPTRVSYKLNLRGPSLAVQTACSTSLVAVHLACQSLLNGECDMALAGGASISVPQKAGFLYQAGGIHSPDGHCRAFDAKAQGTVGGSGVGVVVLKRWADAQADRDHIYALIAGSAINNDGAARVGYTAPSISGQAEVIKEALTVAGLEADAISYVEAHGTGTDLGDPIEVAALTEAFQAHSQHLSKNSCAIGSVKTNIGHLGAAAGVAGLIKTTLALNHRQLPPSLHFEEPNPKLDLANTPFYVNSALAEWKVNESPRCAGVSSFGIGGTNAHVILQEAPDNGASAASGRWSLLPLSAKTDSALQTASANLRDFLERHPECALEDVAYTLQVGRRTFKHRRMLVCLDRADAISRLAVSNEVAAETSVQEAKTRPVAFMFPGQGAQFLNMGFELYRTEEIFRAQVDLCCDILEKRCGLDLRAALYAEDEMGREQAAQRLNQTALAQPAIFVTSYALATLLMKWGIRPCALIGHSIGEYVAACLSGIFSLEDALGLIAARGRLMQELPGGAMLAVSLGEQQLQPYLRESLSLAAVNGPSQTVIAGDVHSIEALQSELTGRGVTWQRLAASHAFHSAMMEPLLTPLLERLSSIELKPPRIPCISTMTGTWMGEREATDPTYWSNHARRTVRFDDAIRELLRQPEWILLEVGPGRTLSSLARRHPEKSREQVVLATLDEQGRGPASEQWLNTVGRLWLAGAPLDWVEFNRGKTPRRIALPTYPFERKRYWINSNNGYMSKPHQTADSSATHRTTQTTHEPVAERQSSEPAGSTRLRGVVEALRQVAHEMSGIEPAAIYENATFHELGFDSLFLMRLSQAIESRFGINITFRDLFERWPTLKTLAEHIAEQAPVEMLPLFSEEEAEDENHPAQGFLTEGHSGPGQNDGHEIETTPSNSTVERIVETQLRLMFRQLEVLSRNGASEGAASQRLADELHKRRQRGLTGAEIPAPDSAQATVATHATNASGARQQTTPQQSRVSTPAGLSLDARQQAYLEAFIRRYGERSAKSKRLTQTHRRTLADNRASARFRFAWKELVYPIVAERSSGARVWDVDGNEYVDLAMGFGVNLLGHNPPFIRQALESQLAQGVQIGPQSHLAGRVSESISRLTGVDRVTFCNSGTEAVMTALRVARAVTRRKRIACFAGSYHGSFDGLLARRVTADGHALSAPSAPGIPPGMVEDLLVLDYASAESLDVLRSCAHTLAAVLVEPVQSRHPALQPKAYLKELRQLTTAAGAALIFDEVITGFRAHPGGAQAWFDVKADLVIYGKVLGGGMPIGAVAGLSAYMDAIDGGAWDYGDQSYPQAEQTFFAGTFCKHPLAMAAADAILEHLESSGPQLQQELNARTARLVDRLNELFQKYSVAIRAEHFSSLFIFTFSDDNKFLDLFFYHLIEKGIYVWEGGTCFLSTAHTDEDIETIVRAVEQTIRELTEGGFLEASPERGDGAPRAGKIPTSEAQKQVWLQSQFDNSASLAYSESMTLRMRGPLDLSALRNSISRLVDAHESLRTTFSPDGEWQLIAPQLTLHVPLADLSSADEGRRETEVERLIAQEASEPFNLEEGPLLRVLIIKLEEEQHLLILTIHHIISDSWSFGVLLDQLGQLYSAECQGRTVAPLQVVQFRDYVQWHADRLQSERMQESERYWRQVFADGVPILELPTDYPRPSVKTYRGARERLILDASLTNDLRALSARRGCGLFITLLTAYTVLLHHWTGQSDLVVGISIAGQPALGGSSMVGFCVNMLPVRSRRLSDPTFAEHLASMKAIVLDVQEHQHFPLTRLLNLLRLKRDPSRLPLVNTVFNLDTPGAPLNFHRLEVDGDTNSSGFTRWDLTGNISESGDHLLIDFTYNTDLFASRTIKRRLEQFQALLRAICAAPENRLSSFFQLLSETEKRQQARAQEEAEVVNHQRLKLTRRQAIVNSRSADGD
jgi:acyl transferase domain-containing protein